MQVAVIGGTGFIGSYIVDALAREGHSVSVLCRLGSEHKLPRQDLFRVVAGELDDSDALTATVSGCDAVVYAVGILRENRRQGVTFERLQYDGVVKTFNAAEQAGARRFLLMSANGARSPGTPYQDTKKRAEVAARVSGLDVTIFQPSVVFGDPRGRMEIATQLYRDMVRPPVPAIGFFSGLRPASGQVLMSPVHVEDVADAFVAALVDNETIGRVYVLGGPGELSWTSMIREVGAAVGRRKWVLPMPFAAMKAAATLLDWLPLFPVTRDQLTMLAEGNTAAPHDLADLIGREPRPFSVASLGYLCARPGAETS